MEGSVRRSPISSLPFFGATGPARDWLLAAVATVAIALGAGYHVLTLQNAAPAGIAGKFVYELVVLFGYLIVYLFLSERFRDRPTSSIRVFWSPLIAGLGFLVVHYLVTSFGRPPDMPGLASATLGFEYETGRPLVPATILKMTVLSLGGAVFSFILLLRFRDLVLVKRTRSSQRNWYLMLGLMVFASALTFGKSPESEPTAWQRLAIIPAVGFMVVNSLRLSWIVFLRFSEKIICIGMAFVLILLLSGIGIMEDSIAADALDIPSSYTFIKHYSYPLSQFVTLSIIFGILYTATALLSLFFHLPTTSDFQQRAGELAAMHSFTHLVGQVMEPDKLYSSIVMSPLEAGAASASWLAIPDRSSPSLAPMVVAVGGMTTDQVLSAVDLEAIFDEVKESGADVLLEQAPADHRVRLKPGEGIGSLLAVPLLARDEVLGALFVTKEVSQGFERDDVNSIGVFAAQAALAIDNARLFEERIDRERLSRELAIAREVQRKLLPQTLPAMAGLSIAADSVPAQEVGGDYYDFIKLNEDRLAFIIADVSGKGTSAAFYMAEMQGIFRSLSRISTSPVDFLMNANIALSATLERNVFVSVIYGVVDVAVETLTMARAGHCPAARIGIDGRAQLLRSNGMGLGLDTSPLFSETLSEEVIDLQPGDVFALYTDGIVESRNPAGTEYGYDRLLSILCNNRHEEAGDLHAVLFRDLDSFVGKAEYDDDTTLVVLKWHGIEVSNIASLPAFATTELPEA
jgi:serine phosphatase RsbU (regulator of sigma subunit)